jgi:hypothetical protein
MTQAAIGSQTDRAGHGHNQGPFPASRSPLRYARTSAEC